MKFSVVLALVAAATAVSAETNAQRLARGLSPNAPGKRATPVELAARHHPSGTPSQCNTGSAQCCQETQTTGQGKSCDGLLSDLGLSVVSNVVVGLSCSPILGTGADCSQEPVCCEDNSYNGLINIGCSPININL